MEMKKITEQNELHIPVLNWLWDNNASLGKMQDHAVLSIKEFNVL